MFLLRLLLSFMSVFHSSSENNADLRAYSPGDIVIGGLVPIHLQINRSEMPEDFVCTDYNLQMFLRSQVMIFAIEEVNQRTPRLLPNLTLGYDIYDTCGDVSLAIRASLQLMMNQSDPQSRPVPESINASLPEPQTKVVIGERYSEVSTAVARILALASVSQLSYASTSELLSNKFKFPTFFRTVPGDRIQTKAIFQLMKEFNWKTVAVVGSDDEYGRYGSDRLLEIFRKNGICVDFVEILSGDFKENNNYASETLMNLLGTINTSTAEAIILFTEDTNVKTILEEVIKNDLNRTWIASDSWSTDLEISNMPGIEKIGPVFGFIYKEHEVPGFRDYVHSMFNGRKNDILKYHLSHFPRCPNLTQNMSCSYSLNCSDPNCLASLVDQDESYSIYLAVQVIVEGLRRVLKCDDHRCEQTEFTAFELFKEIQNTNVTINTTKLYFKDGDPSLGYDIVYWNHSVSSQGVEIQKIGEYYPNETITLPEGLRETMDSVKVTAFECAKTCEPGQMLKIKCGMCCFSCVQCEPGSYSPGNGTECTPCSNQEYPTNLQDQCLTKPDDFLQWTEPISILLSSFAVLAIIIIIVFGIVIRINCKTPVVKAVGGCLCFLELCSLMLNFCVTFTFLGKPTKNNCVGIPVFGFGFALCISCILANLLQILLGFNFDVKVRAWIKRLNKPLVVVFILSGIQLTLSVLWLVAFPSVPIATDQPTAILHQCEMNGVFQCFFAVTVTYNASLGFICFIFAFKGRQLPDLYKNASLITVSMVLFLIIWIIFLPLFLALEGRFKPAISSAAILISCYSILSCHLAPKCYIMVFRKEQNNEHAITEYIRKHYERKGLSVVK